MSKVQSISKTKMIRPKVFILQCLAYVGLLAASACSTYPEIGAYNGLYVEKSTNGSSSEFVGDSLKVVHLSHSNLLFFDGKDSVLIDGYFSRPNSIFCRKSGCRQEVKKATELIENQYGLTTISVVVPLHSHFDHAMDVGEVSHLTCAQVLGSISTKMIFDGWRSSNGTELLEKCKKNTKNQGKGDSGFSYFEPAYIYKRYEYGNFSILLLPGKHVAPNYAEGRIEGEIPVNSPAIKYKSGEVYNILVSHSSGFSALVVGSSGLPDFRLRSDIDVDIVFLGVAGIGRFGRSVEDSDRFLRAVIDEPKAEIVIPIHWDEFFGPISAQPQTIGGFAGRIGRPERSLFRTCDYVARTKGRSIKFLPFFEEFNVNVLTELPEGSRQFRCPSKPH